MIIIDLVTRTSGDHFHFLVTTFTFSMRGSTRSRTGHLAAFSVLLLLLRLCKYDSGEAALRVPDSAQSEFGVPAESGGGWDSRCAQRIDTEVNRWRNY